jgi:penicillin-binding protein 1C
MIRLTGRFSGRLRRAAQASALLGGLLLLVWWFLPRCEIYPALSWSQVVLDRDGRVLNLTLAADGRYRVPVKLAQVPEEVQKATLTYEDRRYWAHPGFDPGALARAGWGILTGTPRGGGSTLTMQVARLRFDLDTKTLGGKVEQVFRAIQLERHYSKTEILEAYYNLAPYGGNVEGLGAASLLWCRKKSSELTLREACALTVIPQSPSSRRPRADGSLSVGAQKATQRLLRAMEDRGEVRPDPLGDAFRLAPQAPPREVPHLARRLCLATKDAEIMTTIKRDAQQQVAASMANFLRRQEGKGLNNACALLVDAPTRQVLAYVGSAEFLDKSILGQVDGIMARRSPGSLIKPFVYGLALDEGLIHSRSLLSDAPLHYADYDPENFEREFMGPVFADEALARSRNIPAISLTNSLKQTTLYQFLKRSQVPLDHPQEYYGLALCLGGFELSPERAAGLYAALASDGEARPLVMRRGEARRGEATKGLTSSGGKSMGLSEASRFLVLQMLRRGASLGANYAFAQADPEVAWKTGTSHGFRDAWAAGIKGRTVLLVWMGNFDGSQNASLVARTTAAPLMFDIFRGLSPEMRAVDAEALGHLAGDSQVAPETVGKVELCATSGMIPMPFCPHRMMGWFIPGTSPIAPCTLHRRVWIDPTSGLRVLRNDGRANLREEVREFWPPEMLNLFRLAGVPRTPPPGIAAGSVAANDSGMAPRVLSPLPGRSYLLDRSNPARRCVPLRAETFDGSARVFWFANGIFIGSSAPSEDFLWSPEPGDIRLQAVDEAGRSTTVAFVVGAQ